MIFNIIGGRSLAGVAVVAISSIIAVACDDILDSPTPVLDGGVGPVSDASLINDASSEAGSNAAPSILAIAPGKHARLFNVAWTAAGIYAVGQVGVTESGDDLATILVKMLPSGALDTSFGSGGIVTKNIVASGAGEIARGIVVQPDGKIVVAGAFEHGAATDATRDLFIARFLATGLPDTAFGTNGVATHVLSNGEQVQQYGLALLGNGDFIVTGTRRAGARSTNELTVLRASGTNGALVPSFAATDAGSNPDAGGVPTSGVFSLAFDTSVSPRGPVVLADGKILVTAYTNAAGNKPILLRLRDTGALDNTFGNGGVYFPQSGIDGFGTNGSTEAYGAIVQTNRIVTVGYGKVVDTQPGNGWIALGFTHAGVLDPTFATSGHTYFGINDQNANARAITSLGDGRIVMVGGGSPPKPSTTSPTQSQHAALVVLSANGVLDPSNASGPRLYDLGGPATGRLSHQFWDVATSPDGRSVVAVGIKGSVTADAGITAGRDEAAVLVLPLSP